MFSLFVAGGRKRKKVEKLRELTKFDVIVDEGRDGWTFLATKMEANIARGGGAFKKSKKEKAPVFASPCVTLCGYLRRRSRRFSFLS